MTAQPRSLLGRLLLPLLVIVAAVWLAVAAITRWDVRHELDELFDSHLSQAASLLAAQGFDPHGGDADERADVADPVRHARKVAFQVFHDGHLVLRSASAPREPLLPVAPGRLQSGFATVRASTGDWRVYAASGHERDIQVYVGERLDSRSAIVWASVRSMLWPMLLALPLLALAAGWSLWRGLSPLRRLGQALAQRRPEALDPVDMPQASSELQPVLSALNQLFARMAASLAAERRFTADAAHELRTPIAALRAQAQVALASADEVSRRHALQATLAACERASHLVDQMLMLARVEGGTPPPLQALDLAALARDVLADLAGAALDRGQDLSLEAADVPSVQGDRALLAVLLRNLVDNAVRYSPRGARLSVGVREQDGAVLLEVEDGGPGLSEAMIARYGERFVRGEGVQASGSGLGASIVRRIAAVHGARVAVDRSPELGGLRVRVRFPQTA